MSPVSHKGQHKLIWTETNIWPWFKSKELTFCRPQAKAQHLIFRREIYSLSRCPSPCPLVIPIPVTQHTCSSQWSTQICCPFSRAEKQVQANQSNIYIQTLIQQNTTAWRTDFQGGSVLTPSLDAMQLCHCHLFPFQRGSQQVCVCLTVWSSTWAPQLLHARHKKTINCRSPLQPWGCLKLDEPQKCHLGELHIFKIFLPRSQWIAYWFFSPSSIPCSTKSHCKAAWEYAEF